MKEEGPRGSNNAASHAQKDVAAGRSEYLFPIPSRCLNKLLLSSLSDTRDAPMLYLLFNIMVTVVPTVCLMYTTCHSHWIGLAYLLANYAFYLQRFMLTLHFTEHRRLFKSGG